ncbi:MAG TPA: hypothetical protein VEX16_05635 [Methyloceanibacter sp.]|jgi:hypothetical protein|nr:hypothetical protein [Methyloceanibacter sp.]
MHNDEHTSPYHTQTGPETSAKDAEAKKEWSDLERDLGALGQQLAELRSHTAALGEHFVNNLQARFQDVQSRAESFKTATEQQLDELRQSTWQQANDARARSKETARQMWERSEPLRQGARDVGEGLGRAWTELRASLGKAASRMQTENGTATAATTPTPVPTPPGSEHRREAD